MILNFHGTILDIVLYVAPNVADCEVDTGAVGFNGTRDTDAMTHGTTVIYSCTSDMCTGTRICFDGVWNGTLPSCPGKSLIVSYRKAYHIPCATPSRSSMR